MKLFISKILILPMTALLFFVANAEAQDPSSPTLDPSQNGAVPITLQSLPGLLKEKKSNPTVTIEAANEMIRLLKAPYNYQDLGKRDPFIQPEILKTPDSLPAHGPFLPLQAFAMEQIRVKGIVWSVRKPKALLEAEGKLYTVSLGDRVGNKNGYVAVIREGEVVIVETYQQGNKETTLPRVLTLKK